MRLCVVCMLPKLGFSFFDSRKKSLIAFYLLCSFGVVSLTCTPLCHFLPFFLCYVCSILCELCISLSVSHSLFIYIVFVVRCFFLYFVVISVWLELFLSEFNTIYKLLLLFPRISPSFSIA